MLNGKKLDRKMHTVWFHSCKGPEEVNLIYVLKVSHHSCLWGIVIGRRHKEDFRGAGHIPFLIWVLLRGCVQSANSHWIVHSWFVHFSIWMLYFKKKVNQIKVLPMNREQFLSRESNPRYPTSEFISNCFTHENFIFSRAANASVSCAGQNNMRIC